MIIIPIGVDCGIASFCKKYNLRSFALPFDWCVSYNGVSKCIEDEFKYFLDPLTNRINIYDIYFHHDFTDKIAEDTDKYIRRTKRFMNILETSNEDIVFVRKGHANHHHYEHNCKYSNIKSDIDDTEDLDIIISQKYPHLKYKIIIVLVCGKCFDANKNYTSKSDNIEIYNIATPTVDNNLFEKCISKVLLK
jgi:hypothetical protein